MISRTKKNNINVLRKKSLAQLKNTDDDKEKCMYIYIYLFHQLSKTKCNRISTLLLLDKM